MAIGTGDSEEENKRLWLKEQSIPFFSWGFGLFDKWLQIRNSEKTLELYFKDNFMQNIAIYGLGAIGKRLYEELLQSPVRVSYGIDQNAENIFVKGLEIKTLKEELPEVDAVIVTPVMFYEIQKNLYQKVGKDTDIIFIEDVVEYCFKQL